MKNFVTITSLVLGLTAYGCGGGGGDFTTGVDQGKKVSDLTPSEQKQFCDADDKLTKDGSLQRPLCRFMGAFSGAIAASFGGKPSEVCTEAYNECMADDGSSDGDAECDVDTTCTATVGEVEKCFNDALKVMATLGNKAPTCDKVTADTLKTLTDSAQSLENPAACEALSKKCPGGDFDIDLEELSDVEVDEQDF